MIKSRALARNLYRAYSSTTANPSFEFISLEYPSYDWNEHHRKLNESKKPKFLDIGYSEQIEAKKNIVAEAVRNIITTISYEENLSDELKCKQVNQGQRLLDNLQTILLSSGLVRNVLSSDIYRVIDEQGLKRIKTREAVSFDDYPQEFYLVTKHLDQFLASNQMNGRSKRSYYDKSWHWDTINIKRGSPSGQLTLNVAFNPQSVNNNDLAIQKSELKNYFADGPGRECSLSTLNFQVLDPERESRLIEEDLLIGSYSIQNKISGHDFEFMSSSYYPEVFESYANLNKELCEQLNQSGDCNTLVEIGGSNGVLASLHLTSPLRRNSIKNILVMQHSQSSVLNSIKNLDRHDLFMDNSFSFRHFTNLSKVKQVIFKYLEETDVDVKICAVLHSYAHSNLNSLQRGYRKLNQKLLRKTKQVKTLLLVNQLASVSSFEHEIFELMCAEKRREGIEGAPFILSDMKLVDQMPGAAGCYIITRLERE